jgi:DNA-binding response OmpR family regulator
MAGLLIPGRSGAAKPARSETLVPLRALSVSPVAEDHHMLRHVLDGALWRISTAATLHGAIQSLRTKVFSVIVCESVLEDGTWKDLLDHNRACSYAPPLIVTSRLADEYLWAEVLNLGGYDVLPKPFNDREVRHVLQTISLQQARAATRVCAAGAA